MKQFVLLLFLSATCAMSGPSAEPLRLEASLDAMGSVFSIVAYGDDRTTMESAVEDAFEEVRRLDRMLSNYRSNSEWSKVNRLAGSQSVIVSTELFRLLAACNWYSAASDGAFDISVGPLMKVWGFYRGSGRLPHRSEVRSALRFVGYRRLLLDDRNSAVRFERPGVELDPGGIGKGYAVDQIVKVLKTGGIRSALVSAGGSSIFAMSSPPNEPGWRVAIRNPLNKNLSIEEITLRDQSMSTSGTYEKFFTAGGQIYSHIMDPRTGWPAPGMLSVSVIAPAALDSEAWTKPVFINGRRWAAERLPKGLRAYLCEDPAGRGARTRFADKRMEPQCAWLQ